MGTVTKDSQDQSISDARGEFSRLRSVCCAPGTDITGEETLWNVKGLQYKRVTHQHGDQYPQNLGIDKHVGGTFLVFSSKNYGDQPNSNPLRVTKQMPCDDNGNVIDAGELGKLHKHTMSEITKELSHEVALAHEIVEHKKQEVMELDRKLNALMTSDFTRQRLRSDDKDHRKEVEVAIERFSCAREDVSSQLMKLEIEH